MEENLAVIETLPVSKDEKVFLFTLTFIFTS
jgi:hypothetical protein